MTTEATTPSMELEVTVGGTPSTRTTFNGDAATSETPTSEGLGVDFLPDGTVAKAGLAGLETETTEEPEGEVTSETTTETPEAPAGDDPLPEFNAEDADNLKAYESRFFTFPEDGGPGTLNLSALETEWEANAAKEGAEGGALSEGTYAFLEHTLGLPKATVKELEAGRVALREANDAAFYAKTGGKDGYETMLAWGKENYSEDQKTAFNEALKAGGQALEDQLEVLSSRFGKANPKEPEAKTRRPSAPARSAGGSPAAGAASKDVFKDNKEYLAALSEAGRDVTKQKAASEKLARSTFWR